MANRFTEIAQNVLNQSLVYAGQLQSSYVGSEHLLLAVLSEAECVAARILREKGVEKNRVYEMVQISTKRGNTSVTSSDMTPRTKRIIERSSAVANRFGQNYIGTEHLLMAMLEETDCIAVRILISCGIYISDLEEQLQTFFQRDIRGLEEDEIEKSAAQKRSKTKTVGMGALAKYGIDMTHMAREGRFDPIIGRDEETERVIRILSRRTKNNPCLIGEPGVGKTAVVEGLAQRIAKEQVPEGLRNKIVFRLDISSMIAGAKYRGEFEERMKSVMEQVQQDPNIILFIDEIHTIVGAGAAEGAVDAANIMKPALARAQMQVIGATTLDEYRKHIERDAALERRFQSVMVSEPSEEGAIGILMGLRDKFEAHHKVKITDAAIESAVHLSNRYISDRCLPDKAIDLIDEAASRKRIEMLKTPPLLIEMEALLKSTTKEKEAAIKAQDFEEAAKLRDRLEKMHQEYKEEEARFVEKRDHVDNTVQVESDDVAQIVTSWTGIPVQGLTEDDGQRMTRLENELRRRVIGQDEAISSIVRSLKRARAGLCDPDRPTGSFLFVGPTGVGKTELAKTVCGVLFEDPAAMIRLDMSEYMEKHSVSKLIGSPPGYIGYEEGGRLTERVRRRPYSLILLDEIEKAHPDVFNLLLQILDDGILTDAKGRRVDFKNTILIMTSNVGTDRTFSKRALGFTSDAASVDGDMRSQVMAAIRQTFRPEFLNRIDETVLFSHLTSLHMRAIVQLMMGDLEGRLHALGVTLEYDNAVLDLICQKGFDPQYGARPLRRTLRSMIEDPLSSSLLEGTIKKGDYVLLSVVKDCIAIGRQ